MEGAGKNGRDVAPAQQPQPPPGGRWCAAPGWLLCSSMRSAQVAATMPRFLRCVVPIGLGVAGACRSAPPPGVEAVAPSASAAACVVGRASTARPGGTATIVLSQPVEPAHAPAPTGDAERFVFRQAYETLVRVDCQGRVEPGLAANWRTSDGGRSWTFHLRESASFWDGSAVHAADVLESWRPHDGRVGPLARVGTVTGSAGRDLTVLLAVPSATVPVAFADPALAVVKPLRESRWPMGSGAYWIADGADSARIELRRVAASSDAEFDIYIASADSSARTPGRPDFVLARDASLWRGAALRRGYVATPLPWDRVYALWARGAAVSELPRRMRAALAGRMGAEDSRPAERPEWWDATRGCPPVAAPRHRAPTGATKLPRVAYPAGDAMARALAVRVAALVDSGVLGKNFVPPRGAQTRVAALAPAALRAALGAGERLAIVPLPRRTYGRCAELPGAADGLIALTDSRLHAVVRDAAVGFALDWDGTPRLGR